MNLLADEHEEGAHYWHLELRSFAFVYSSSGARFHPLSFCNKMLLCSINATSVSTPCIQQFGSCYNNVYRLTTALKPYPRVWCRTNPI
jgi:hypothetical protein